MITDLDVFEMEGLFAVSTVERSLRTFTLIVAFQLIGPHQLFAGGTKNDHEVTVALMVGLWAIEICTILS